MKIGLQINRFTWNGRNNIGPILEKIAKTADEGGFYSVWVMDHFFQIPSIGSEDEPMLEAYTTLGFLAGVTQNVKLGTLVSGVIYRQPSLLVKNVTTLDVLSEGRAYIGIGAAWNEAESLALGFPFPPLKERFERLEETLQIALQMWEGSDKLYKGKYYILEKPLNRPQSITKPHPPILIGGGGEKKTLKLVAKYADACNLFLGSGFDELSHKLDVLREHCRQVGRDYNEIEKTVLESIRDEVNPDEVIEQCKILKKMGFDQVIFGIRNVEDIKPLNIFVEKIIPKVSNI